MKFIYIYGPLFIYLLYNPEHYLLGEITMFLRIMDYYTLLHTNISFVIELIAYF
jgi:hypothetical protein